MSAITTRAPSRARRSAVARPMPEPAPVTMAVLPVKRPGMGGGWGAPWVPGSAGNSLVLDTAASSLTRGCRLTPCSTAPRRYGVPLRLAAQRKAQAVRSASIVAVGTIPSSRRASSASRVTNASAWSWVRATYSAS